MTPAMEAVEIAQIAKSVLVREAIERCCGVVDLRETRAAVRQESKQNKETNISKTCS
jgi:hypothetical protein